MDEETLRARVRAIAGRTVGELAARFGAGRGKGALGVIVERALGAVGNEPGPDFGELGIELKTIPLDARGLPRESTFVCCAPRDEVDWESSLVRRKLARVLFVPIEADAPLLERRIGSAILWSPDAALEATLRRDFEMLTSLLARSPADVSASIGDAIQLRPKARHGGVRRRFFDLDGVPVMAMPRAFYLRRSVTRAIFAS